MMSPLQLFSFSFPSLHLFFPTLFVPVIFSPIFSLFVFPHDLLFSASPFLLTRLCIFSLTFLNNAFSFLMSPLKTFHTIQTRLNDFLIPFSPLFRSYPPRYKYFSTCSTAFCRWYRLLTRATTNEEDVNVEFISFDSKKEA